MVTVASDEIQNIQPQLILESMSMPERTGHIAVSDPRNPLGDMEDGAINGFRSVYLNLEAKSLLVAIYILAKSNPSRQNLCPMGPLMTAHSRNYVTLTSTV